MGNYNLDPSEPGGWEYIVSQNDDPTDNTILLHEYMVLHLESQFVLLRHKIKKNENTWNAYLLHCKRMENRNCKTLLPSYNLRKSK